ncbi:MAG: hypothetical protein V1737_02150 [Chloroflexota bacterium]
MTVLAVNAGSLPIHEQGIMRRLFHAKEVDMWGIAKRVIGTITVLLTCYVVITSLLAAPSRTALSLMMAVGILLMVIGILSSLRRHSRVSIGVVGRAEFYGALVTMAGYMMYMNTRIDQIMLQLMQ